MAVIIRTAARLVGSSLPSTGFTSLWWAPATVGGSTADATDALAVFRSFWDGVKALITPTITVTFDPICIAVEASTGALTGAFTGTQPLDVVGTATGDPLPLQTQGLLRFSTATVVAGRRVRGRLFVPGASESQNGSNALPSSTYLSTVNTAAGLILAGGATATDAVIWHRPTAGAGGASPVITGVGCASTWSVLRSRRS